MKNSVKDRSNAQASCAANFISEHLHPSFTGGWLHVDLAGPAFLEDRGTGFGVGLVVDLLGEFCKETGPVSAPAGKKRAR
jgi:probable aminopeptidase NPEPL1